MTPPCPCRCEPFMLKKNGARKGFARHVVPCLFQPKEFGFRDIFDDLKVTAGGRYGRWRHGYAKSVYLFGRRRYEKPKRVEVLMAQGSLDCRTQRNVNYNNMYGA